VSLYSTVALKLSLYSGTVEDLIYRFMELANYRVSHSMDDLSLYSGVKAVTVQWHR